MKMGVSKQIVEECRRKSNAGHLLVSAVKCLPLKLFRQGRRLPVLLSFGEQSPTAGSARRSAVPLHILSMACPRPVMPQEG